MFAPIQDRAAPGRGFTHKIGDRVRVSTPRFGVLEERNHSTPSTLRRGRSTSRSLCASWPDSACSKTTARKDMTMTLSLSHFIGGERVSADAHGESLNPSDTRDVVAHTPEGGRPRSTPRWRLRARPSRPGRARRPRCAPTCSTVSATPSSSARTSSAACCRVRKARPCRKGPARSCAPDASSSTSPAKRFVVTARTWTLFDRASRSRLTARQWASTA